jgi:hypothetical protein
LAGSCARSAKIPHHLLLSLNENADWRPLVGKKSRTLKDHELVLRFLTLFQARGTYTRPMKDFLNTFMAKNRRIESVAAE